MLWGQAAIDDLKRRCAEGESARSISDALAAAFNATFSRSAVIGKANRLGLRLTGGAGGRSSSAETKRKRRNRGVLHGGKAAEVVDLPHDQTDCGVSFLELKSHHCRYPIGDPASADFLFCGSESLRSQTYCPRHCEIAFAPSPNQPRAKRDPAQRRAFG